LGKEILHGAARQLEASLRKELQRYGDETGCPMSESGSALGSDSDQKEATMAKKQTEELEQLQGRVIRKTTTTVEEYAQESEEESDIDDEDESEASGSDDGDDEEEPRGRGRRK
jgi:hypothetical protein